MQCALFFFFYRNAPKIVVKWINREWNERSNKHKGCEEREHCGKRERRHKEVEINGKLKISYLQFSFECRIRPLLFVGYIRQRILRALYLQHKMMNGIAHFTKAEPLTLSLSLSAPYAVIFMYTGFPFFVTIIRLIHCWSILNGNIVSLLSLSPRSHRSRPVFFDSFHFARFLAHLLPYSKYTL